MRSKLLLVLSMTLLLAPVAAEERVYESVQQLLRDARNRDLTGEKLVVKEVLVTSGPEKVNGDYNEVAFTIRDFERVDGDVRAVGESLRVRLAAYYSGQNPFNLEDDNSWDGEIEVPVEAGQVISFVAYVELEFETNEWELVRPVEDDGLWDEDLYQVYVDGAKREDYEYAVQTLSTNYGLDDLSEWSEGDAALAEFSGFLQETFGFGPITGPEVVDDHLIALEDLKRGLRAVFTIHTEGVEPVSLTPNIAYVRPYTRLRQGVVTTVKVDNPGAKPAVALDGRRLEVVHRLPGLLLVKIPQAVPVGEHWLTLTGDGGKTSERFRLWVKPRSSAVNPAPVLNSATVVGGPEAAVMVLEGAHFTQQGDVRLYLGARRIPGIRTISRQHDTVHLELPVSWIQQHGLSFTSTHVRVGRGRSNSIEAKGSGFLQVAPDGQPRLAKPIRGMSGVLSDR